MKKSIIISLSLFFLSLQSTFALSRERASEEADFLTDKMAYELGLTPSQWSDVYEINYDFFRHLGSLSRNYAPERELRDRKLKYVLTVSQWERYRRISYFYTPVSAGLNDWVFAIYSKYTRNKFYGDPRRIVSEYRGAHRTQPQFYQNRYESMPRPQGGHHFPQSKPSHKKHGNIHNSSTNHLKAPKESAPQRGYRRR